MTCRRYRQAAGVVLAAALAASCGETAQQGRSPAYLVMEQLSAASGAKPGTTSNVLESDVITNVKVTLGGDTVLVPTVFEDAGEVQLHVALKDPGTPTTLVDPSPMNFVTVDRYRVTFIRADGRNTPGVDVPYPFDGAATGTITGGSSKLVFVLVRAQAKKEAPLQALQGMGGAQIISTIAEVTFYGKDQAGHAVSVTGRISVNFADWGDPTS
ncbi:MAG: hypothetical protein EHM24_25545 [Acidobacteria bacterium]|nr:MAG: hypothetical protein EHM24_25545 [Acidobacteriota bacterium]